MNEKIIYVHDVKKMKDYYIQKLGFTLLETKEGENLRYVLGFEQTPVRIVLASRSEVSTHTPIETPSLLLKVKDIHQVYEAMKDHGVKVSDLFELGNIKTFNFADSEDHYMAIWQR